eukprot:g3983.t1
MAITVIKSRGRDVAINVLWNMIKSILVQHHHDVQQGAVPNDRETGENTDVNGVVDFEDGAGENDDCDLDGSRSASFSSSSFRTDSESMYPESNNYLHSASQKNGKVLEIDEIEPVSSKDFVYWVIPFWRCGEPLFHNIDDEFQFFSKDHLSGESGFNAPVSTRSEVFANGSEGAVSLSLLDDVMIKFVKNLQELRRILATLHLLRPIPCALIIEDIDALLKYSRGERISKKMMSSFDKTESDVINQTQRDVIQEKERDAIQQKEQNVAQEAQQPTISDTTFARPDLEEIKFWTLLKDVESFLHRYHEKTNAPRSRVFLTETQPSINDDMYLFVPRGSSLKPSRPLSSPDTTIGTSPDTAIGTSPDTAIGTSSEITSSNHSQRITKDKNEKVSKDEKNISMRSVDPDKDCTTSIMLSSHLHTSNLLRENYISKKYAALLGCCGKMHFLQADSHDDCIHVSTHTDSNLIKQC